MNQIDTIDTIDKFRNEYFFLSNFSSYSLMYKGIRFNNSEQAYHYEKATNSIDKQEILKCNTASEAKRIGRKIKLDITEWDKKKIYIMEDILRAKFSQEHLKSKLLNTGNKKLIEGNYWHDNFYGNCYCYKCKNIIGENNLGKSLMKIREELKTIPV